MPRATWGKICLALLPPILLAAFWAVFAKAKMVWLHVDDGTPVSEERASITKVMHIAEGTEKKSASALDRVACAVQELEKQRRDVASQPVRGTISRDIKLQRGRGNVVFVNSNSDARRFQLNESVVVVSLGKTIGATVKGIITNPDDTVIGQLNEDAATELGLSPARGVAQHATIKRDLPAPANEPTSTSDCLSRANAVAP